MTLTQRQVEQQHRQRAERNRAERELGKQRLLELLTAAGEPGLYCVEAAVKLGLGAGRCLLVKSWLVTLEQQGRVESWLVSGLGRRGPGRRYYRLAAVAAAGATPTT